MPLTIVKKDAPDAKPELPTPELTVSASEDSSHLFVNLDFLMNYPDEAIETSEREIMKVTERDANGKAIKREGTGEYRVTSSVYGKAVKIPLGFDINGLPALFTGKIVTVVPAEKGEQGEDTDAGEDDAANAE